MAVVETMQNRRLPKQIAAAAVEGIRKRGRPCKRWRGELEEDLNVVEIKKKHRQTMARDRLEWEMTVLVANVHNGLWRLKRRRKRRRIHDCCLSCFLKCGFQCFAELVTPDIFTSSSPYLCCIPYCTLLDCVIRIISAEDK